MGQFFNQVYKMPTPGTVNNNGIFMVQVKTPVILVTEAVRGIDRAEHKLNRLGINANVNTRGGRTILVTHRRLELETRPGLRPIKRVELHDTWGAPVPEHFRNDICPKPSDTIITPVKEERNVKINAKKASGVSTLSSA